MESGYYYGEDRLNTEKLFEKSFWKEAASLKEGQNWNGFYKSDHYNGGGEPVETLGIVLPIKGRYGFLNGSKLLIESNAEELFSYIRFLENDIHSLVTIRDSNQKVIYETMAKLTPVKTDIVRSTNLTAYDWNIEVRVPEKIFYQSSKVIFNYTLLGIFFSILLASLLAICFRPH